MYLYIYVQIFIGVIEGLYGDNGKEDGNYYLGFGVSQN